MNPFFRELGETVLKRWKQKNFSLEEFPGLAVDVLRERPPADHVDLAGFLRAFLLDDAQCTQTESGFGEPEIIVYENARFYIQLLFWMDGTTAIHQHEFSGAFHVMSGSSIHARFGFENVKPVTPYFRTGDLRMKEIALLETGCTVPIVSGKECIHSLFHLDTPSVTVVVRTQHDPGTGPQFNYLPPHVAYDPVFSDPLLMRRRQVLDMLERTEDAAYLELVLAMIAELDFEGGFHILQSCLAHLRDSGGWDQVYGVFQKKHGVLSKGMQATLDECVRRDLIKSMRCGISDPEHRFFLALLLNVPTRGDIFALVEQRFPEIPAHGTIMRWLEELLEEAESGVTILDALFPQEWDVDPDNQAEVFLSGISRILNGSADLPDDFPTGILPALRGALNGSSLAILVD